MRLILIGILFLAIDVTAQNATKNSFTFSKSATVNMSEVDEDWNINLQHLEAPKPGVGIRGELMEKKQLVQQLYPKTLNAENNRAATNEAPFLGTNFEGNTFNGVPNDNDLAISNGGKIVSVTNSRIHIYDASTQEELSTRSLGSFASDLGVSGSKYDPKVLYDPNNDRFVMIFLNGFTFETSQIIVAFSKTNDPTEDWNLYALPGNPLDNESWSDYPVVGISGKDLFIGINTFLNGSQNNSGFVETCLWQIGLKEGYIGFDLNTNYFSDILPSGNTPIFNICPISPSAESEMENMYLLSNRNLQVESDIVFLLEVTGRVSDSSTELNVTNLTTDQPYTLPVPANQSIADFLDTNDGRILGGYYHNNQLYYVQSCTDPTNGRAAIYLGLISDVAGNPTITSRIISQPDLDYGFPNISWSGQTSSDEESIISFNHSSETTFAGFSAVHVDASLTTSDRIEIKEGLSIVNVMQSDLERWGDYSGSQRKYNQPGTVWAVGSMGNGSGGHGTWIGELRSPNVTTSISELNSDALAALAYPNPFMENISVEFEMSSTDVVRLELQSVDGKLVELLLEDRIKKGTNRIQFNGALLNSGTYFLVARNQEKRLFSKRIVKQ